MNLVDICIILVVLSFMMLGFRDGFLKKIFGIIGFWGGLIVATKFTTTFAESLTRWLGWSEDAAIVIAFSIIFGLLSLIANFSYRWFGQTGTESLKIVSRLGGLLLGAAQGLVAISLILIMCQLFDVPEEESQDESLLYDQTLQIAPEVFDYSTQWIPDSKAFLDELQGKIKRLNSYR